MNTTFKKTALLVCLLCALTILMLSKAMAQEAPTSFVVCGVQLEYMAKYHVPGGGFFGGYKFNNNYICVNTHVPFSRRVNVPIAASLDYNYMIGCWAPYVSAEYYTCGGEAISEGTGKRGFGFGGGIIYYTRSIPLRFSAGLRGLDKLSQVKDFYNYTNVSVGLYMSF